MTVSVANYPPMAASPSSQRPSWCESPWGPAGSNGTAGSWRLQNVDEDAAGLTTTWKVTKDGMSMSSPTGESWDAKFDGKEYPTKGDYVNDTVSVKKLGDRTIEVTVKHEGKLHSIAKMTVSADGKTMTTVFDNKGTGRGLDVY
jgi:hypothetical protein